MDGEPVPMRIPDNDPVVTELRLAVRGGDLETVGRSWPSVPDWPGPGSSGGRKGREPCCILPPNGPGISLTALRWCG